MSSYKLIALDLDGTLLRTDKTISARNRDAVRRAGQAGVHVVLASGRMHSATAKYAVDLCLDPDAPVISYNGAIARSVDGRRTLLDRPLPAEAAKYVVRYAREHGRHLNYYLRDTLFTAAHDRWVDVYFARTGSMAQVVGDLTRFDGERPTKLIVIDDPEPTRDLLPLMAGHFGNAASVMITDDEYLEFMAADVSKGEALQAVARSLGVAREECVAVGDNYNDIPMLEWAGRGVAMSSGRKSLLETVAEHAPPADEDGVAWVIESLLR